jgi:hypothetical protein
MNRIQDEKFRNNYVYGSQISKVSPIVINGILSSSVKVKKTWSFTSMFSFIVMVCSLGKKETLVVPNTVAFPQLFLDSLSIPTRYILENVWAHCNEILIIH